MRVSIVTPVFNQAEFLEETVQSVLAQDYSNLEYIVIDGGSNDGSADIIQRYAAHLTYWVSEPDNGQTHAINKGLAQVTGDVVTWLNGDDVLDPGAVAKVVRTFEMNHNADFVYGDTAVIDPGGTCLYKSKEIPFHRGVLLYGGNLFAQPSCFFRRRVIDRIGLLDETLHWSMDYEYWLRALKAGCQFYHIPEDIARFRIHPASKSVASHARIVDEHFRVYWRHFGAPDRKYGWRDHMSFKARKYWYRFVRVVKKAILRGQFRPFYYARLVRTLSQS